MMCVLWAVIALICLVTSVLTAVGFGMIARWADPQPDETKDLPRTIDCPQCGGMSMLRLGPFVDHRDEEYKCGSCGRVTHGNG